MVVVISPLQALVADQIRRYKVTGYTAVHLGSIDAITAFAANPDPTTRLVFMAPEEATSTAGRRFLANTPIKLGLVAVDEAHCIPEWGSDFRTAFSRIGTLRAAIRDVPFMALTATATEAVRTAVTECLHLTGAVVMGNLNRNNIVIVRKKGAGMESDFKPLIEDLRTSRENTKKHLIYLSTKQKCQTLWRLLDDAVPGSGLVEVFHADLSAGKRKRVLEGLQAGDVRVVIASIAFGMGIDIPDVSCVVTYGPPTSISQLYQQMGRAGRSAQVEAAFIAYKTSQTDKVEPEVQSFMTEEGCLRKALLQHLGQRFIAQQDKCCSNCGDVEPDASCLLSKPPPPPPKVRKKQRRHREKTGNGEQLKERILQLRDREFQHQPRLCFFGPQAVMTDDTIDKLVKWCHRLHTDEDVRTVKGVPGNMVQNILAAIDDLFPEKRNTQPRRRQTNPPQRRQTNPPQRRQTNPQRRQTNPPQRQQTNPPQRQQTNPPQRQQTNPPQRQQTNPPQRQQTNPPLRRSKRHRNPLQDITNNV
ncbi:ATP-dependent DNA helicase Q-like 3 [Branchiostoma floridae]|uniref:DNA 3'-5' helicase n=1 Tax=Branchiostoma floridae TaxID=7739 RepID=A0A9J7LQ81_BRAFL|nr:ATP-dependent DNA helicase Q-like 3 [Branchiostoma floridae]